MASSHDITDDEHTKTQKTESTHSGNTTILGREIVPIKESVELVLQRWSDSWSTQDIDTYLSVYADDFIPSKEMSRGKWEEQRRNRVTSPSFIKVTLANTKIESLGPNHINVEFSQNYQSDSYSDDVRKLISLQKIDDQWLITREKTIDDVKNEVPNFKPQDQYELVAELDHHDESVTDYTENTPVEEVSMEDEEGILRRRDLPPETVLEERSGSPRHEGHQAPPEMDPLARPSEFERDFFGSDPTYPDDVYDVAEQIKIYGGKTPFDEPRPILEWGYPL